MEDNSIDNYSYLLERMEPIEAVSHLIHSRVFELLGYISMARREGKIEELAGCLSRLEEISERLISEFHDYLDYYQLGDNPGNFEKYFNK